MSNNQAILHPIGMLKQYSNGQNDIVVEAGQTIKRMFELMNIPTHIVALVLVNKSVVSKDYVIKENDYIEIMAVLGGG